LIWNRRPQQYGARGKRWSLGNIGKTVLVVALLVEIVLAVRAGRLKDQPPDIATRPIPRGRAPATIALERHVNEKAGYSFGYPKRWKIREQDTLTKLISPDGKAVMLMGVGSARSMNVAAADFMSSLRSIYAHARLERQQRTEVGDTSAIVTSGELINSSGARLKFMSATVRGTPRSFQIAAYYDRRENVKKIERTVEDVLESFRRRTSV
jgi:hypothetical protein